MVDEKRCLEEEGVVFKIDFKKAYDSVDLGFLDHVQEINGFSARCRSWMRGCLSLTSFTILVNENAKGWVKVSRGLRQENPLSPFLFTIAVGVLNRIMLRAEESDLLEGLLVGRNRTRVFHLQFIDETIFFCRASMEGLQNLKLTLLVFRQILRLKINLDKSILSGINTNQDLISRLASILKCEVLN